MPRERGPIELPTSFIVPRARENTEEMGSRKLAGSDWISLPISCQPYWVHDVKIGRQTAGSLAARPPTILQARGKRRLFCCCCFLLLLFEACCLRSFVCLLLLFACLFLLVIYKDEPACFRNVKGNECEATLISIHEIRSLRRSPWQPDCGSIDMQYLRGYFKNE